MIYLLVEEDLAPGTAVSQPKAAHMGSSLYIVYSPNILLQAYVNDGFCCPRMNWLLLQT